jgi:hypothetical protein
VPAKTQWEKGLAWKTLQYADLGRRGSEAMPFSRGSAAARISHRPRGLGVQGPPRGGCEVGLWSPRGERERERENIFTRPGSRAGREQLSELGSKGRPALGPGVGGMRGLSGWHRASCATCRLEMWKCRRRRACPPPVALKLNVRPAPLASRARPQRRGPRRRRPGCLRLGAGAPATIGAWTCTSSGGKK